MEAFFNDLIKQITGYYDDLVRVAPKLGLAIVVLALLFFLANRVQRFTSSKLSAKMDDPLLAKFLSRVVKITLNVIAVFIVLKIVGLADIAAGLITGASVSAIVVGFAFKDIGENLLAGIMLAFNRPFKVGDVVELNGHKGKVVSLNLRNSQIKTFDGKDIFIPNANVIKNPVINYTIDGFLRNEFEVGLDYGSDVDKASEIIQKVMESIEGVLQETKKPDVHISGLGTSTINLKVQYWLDTFDSKIPGSKVRTNAVNQILKALEAEGFYMPGDVIELKNYNNTNLKNESKTNQKIA